MKRDEIKVVDKDGFERIFYTRALYKLSLTKKGTAYDKSKNTEMYGREIIDWFDRDINNSLKSMFKNGQINDDTLMEMTRSIIIPSLNPETFSTSLSTIVGELILSNWSTGEFTDNIVYVEREMVTTVEMVINFMNRNYGSDINYKKDLVLLKWK